MLNLATRAVAFGDLKHVRPWRRWIAEQVAAVAIIAVAALVRTLLAQAFPTVFPFATFFPAVLAASLFGDPPPPGPHVLQVPERDRARRQVQHSRL